MKNMHLYKMALVHFLYFILVISYACKAPYTMLIPVWFTFSTFFAQFPSYRAC